MGAKVQNCNVVAEAGSYGVGELQKAILIVDVKHDIQLRKAKMEDLNPILAVLDGQLDESYHEEVISELNDLKTGRATAFVAELGNEIIGYACWRKKIQLAYLELIAIKPGHQQMGIGSMLLREIINSVKETNPEIGILNVITDADAKDAISFYIKNNFTASGVVNDEFISGVNQIHLSLILKET